MPLQAVRSPILNPGITGLSVYFGDAPPTTGTFNQGDIVVNTATLTTGNPWAWRCTVAGTPGTWEAVGIAQENEYIGPLGATSVSFAMPVSGSLKLIGIRAVFTVAGGAAAALMVERLTGTTAPGGGTNQLTGTIALTGAANTVLTGTMIATPDTFAAGDRIGLVLSGTLTGLANLMVTLAFVKPV